MSYESSMYAYYQSAAGQAEMRRIEEKNQVVRVAYMAAFQTWLIQNGAKNPVRNGLKMDLNRHNPDNCQDFIYHERINALSFTYSDRSRSIRTNLTNAEREELFRFGLISESELKRNMDRNPYPLIEYVNCEMNRSHPRGSCNNCREGGTGMYPIKFQGYFKDSTPIDIVEWAADSWFLKRKYLIPHPIS